jgi:hypothetical protein
MIVDGHVVPAWLAWAVAVLALAGTWACFAVAWQAVAWLGRVMWLRRLRPGDDEGDEDTWARELLRDETRRQLEALPPERDWAEITGQQRAVEAPWTGLSGSLGPAGPPVPYTTTRTALSALLAEHERLRPAWLAEIHAAYDWLGLDDPTLLRALR